jgi:hypothetical protein
MTAHISIKPGTGQPWNNSYWIRYSRENKGKRRRKKKSEGDPGVRQVLCHTPLSRHGGLGNK